MATIRSRYVMVNGVKTHYSESGGDGPVIVALHGGGAGSSGLAGMGPIMRQIGENYRFVALDSVGGFGHTDPAAPSEYGLKGRVEHLKDFVDALCLDQFHLLGNSQGAWVAARYALSYPNRVASLIMIGSATIGQALGLHAELTQSMADMLHFDKTSDGMDRLLRGLVYDPTILTQELKDLRFASAMRPGAMESFKLAQENTRKLQNEPVMRHYFLIGDALRTFSEQIPTLFIWGRNDSFALPELGAQVEKLLPAVEFIWVDKAGHQVQTDQPVQTTDALVTFLDRHTQKADLALPA